MNTNANPIVVIIITIAIVVLFNLVLIAWVRRRKVNNQYKLFQQFMNTAKNPWQQSQSDMDELSELVEKQKKKTSGDDIRKLGSKSSDN